MPIVPILPPVIQNTVLQFANPPLSWGVLPLAICGLLLAVRSPQRRPSYPTTLFLMGAVITSAAAAVGCQTAAPAVWLALLALLTLLVEEARTHAPAAAALTKFPRLLIYTQRSARGTSYPVKQSTKLS